MMSRAILIALSVVSAAACPGSSSFIHAKCEFSVTFPGTTCDLVSEEMIARVNGESGWTDPHNMGTYGIVDTSNPNFLSFSRQTGSVSVGGKNTDLLDFELSETSNGCKVTACSESQVMSVYDFSTNYCNLHDLYCGSGAGCAHVKHDLSFEEDLCVLKCPFHSASQCLPNGPVTDSKAGSTGVVRVSSSKFSAMGSVVVGIAVCVALAAAVVVGVVFRSAQHKSSVRRSNPELRTKLRAASLDETNVV